MSERLPNITGTELVRLLERIGFEVLSLRGSHVTLRRASDRLRTTVPVHGSRDVPVGTPAAILRDVEMSPGDLRRLR